MGWCSGTDIFDHMVRAFLDPEAELNEQQIYELTIQLVDILEEHDWDCQADSAFFGHPEIQDIFRELHPNWFE